MSYEQDVQQLFSQQMGRAASAAEVAEYGGKMAAGADATTVANWLSASPENQARHAAAAAPAPAQAPASTGSAWFDGLNDKYKSVLGRDMDEAGKAYWTTRDATAATDNELEAEWMKGALAELAGRKPAPSPAPTPQMTTSPWQAPTQWNVAGNQTVASQLESVLAKDSPLMQQARTRAMQAMVARGGLNSSMAATAGESAMIDAAMPIATQDAGTYARAGEFNAGQANTFSRDFNQWQRDKEMANFNIGANDWAAERSGQRDNWLANEQLRRTVDLRMAPDPESQTARDEAARVDTLRRGYIGEINNARTNYAQQLAGISDSTSMSTEVKAETLRNLRTTYNTIIRNYSAMLGWDAKSWLIADEAADKEEAKTSTAGKDIDWSQQVGNGMTVRQNYDRYKAQGGTLSEGDWYDDIFSADSSAPDLQGAGA